jgi:hypothetical protein
MKTSTILSALALLAPALTVVAQDDEIFGVSCVGTIEIFLPAGIRISVTNHVAFKPHRSMKPKL